MATGGLMSDIAFVRGDKEKNFTILDNTCIRDETLTWGAKGLHCYLEHLPGDWKIYKSYLISHYPDKRVALNNLINELVKAGYIEVEKNLRNPDGTFAPQRYIVFEKPKNNQCRLSTADNTTADNPLTENQQLLNTNIINTNIKKTKLTNLTEVDESSFVSIIKDLFNGEYPFDKTFKTQIIRFTSENGIIDENIESYLKYVYERTKLGNVKKSFTGLYRTLAFSKSIIRDFKNSSFFKKSEDSISVKCKLEYFDCPICSTRFEKHLGRCPECDLSINQLKDKSLPEYIVRQKLFKMTEEERGKYESELKKRREENKIKKGTSILAPDELIQFWTVCGLLNNQKEN